MIDIHSHILFGLDDGAENMAETKEMLYYASREGIQAIVATPHYVRGKENSSDVQKNYDEIMQWIEQVRLPVTLYLGNEALLSDDLVEDLKEGKCKTLASSQCILVELHNLMPVLIVKRLIFQLTLKGYKPVIAHCDRLIKDKGHKELLLEIVKMGALLQVNASCFTDAGFKAERRVILKLIKKGIISFVASDSHDAKSRKPELKVAYELIRRKFGLKVADDLFLNNQKALLNI